MPHGRKAPPLRRKLAGSGRVGSPWKRLVKMSGFGLSALLRGSYRPCKVCNIFYAPPYYGAVPVEQKIFVAIKARFSLCRVLSHAFVEQIVCIIINLKFKPKKNCSKLE